MAMLRNLLQEWHEWHGRTDLWCEGERENVSYRDHLACDRKLNLPSREPSRVPLPWHEVFLLVLGYSIAVRVVGPGGQRAYRTRGKTRYPSFIHLVDIRKVSGGYPPDVYQINKGFASWIRSKFLEFELWELLNLFHPLMCCSFIVQ